MEGLVRYKAYYGAIDRCATHETHSYEDEMEKTVNLAELESAEIFGGEVIYI